MSSQAGIPVVVVSPRQDDVEAISRCLRNAGQPVHCQWVAEANALPEILHNGRVRLVCVFLDDDRSPLSAVADCRDRSVPGLPILAVAEKVDENAIADVMISGAQDLVSLGEEVRLAAVAVRELSAYQASRELTELREANQGLTEQLASLIDEAADATIYASEGIIVNINQAWLELFGFADVADLVGTPVMDIFSPDSRAAVKGALIACAEGKWSGHEINLQVTGSDGSELAVLADLQPASLDGEPCVRMAMAPERTVVQVDSGRHPVTGLFLRERFVAELSEFINRPATPGVSLLAYLRLDEMGEARDMLDPVSSDQLTRDTAKMITDSVKPNDVYGQFGGDIFMVLLSRGTLRDARAWAENLRETIARHVFEAGNKSLSLTATIGLAQFDSHSDDTTVLMHKAQQAFRDGRDSGGNKVVILELDGSLDRGIATISLEVVKQSLMQDGFRLVFQPIASMLGKTREMYDVLIRMRGPDNSEIMPADFLPTARRGGLMKNIDRWVCANAIRFCVKNKSTQLFIRLSEDSIADQTLVPWIEEQISQQKINASQLAFQVTEQHAEKHLKECKQLALQLQAIDCTFAIEHFGVGHRPLQTLEHIPADSIKVDGSLMESLVSNPDIQEKVQLYIEAAKSRNIETIAERVEDANTMAVLWQLGVEFIQGYYVQGPEEIVLESIEISA